MKTRRILVRFSLIILPFLLFNCTEGQEEIPSPFLEAKTNVHDLPKIGHYDIVYEETEGYQIGDTIFHVIPEWEYLNQDSVWINSSDLEGKIWIADFIFTHCPSVCSPMTQNLNEINKELSDFADEIQFLSFSIDPKRDTIARLKEYIEEHEITAKNWYFFTGDQEETNRMAFDDFQIFAAEDDRAPGGFAHSSNFVLIDKDRHIRGIYNGVDEADQKRLIAETLLLLGH